MVRSLTRPSRTGKADTQVRLPHHFTTLALPIGVQATMLMRKELQFYAPSQAGPQAPITMQLGVGPLHSLSDKSIIKDVLLTRHCTWHRKFSGRMYRFGVGENSQTMIYFTASLWASGYCEPTPQDSCIDFWNARNNRFQTAVSPA